MKESDNLILSQVTSSYQIADTLLLPITPECRGFDQGKSVCVSDISIIFFRKLRCGCPMVSEIMI